MPLLVAFSTPVHMAPMAFRPITTTELVLPTNVSAVILPMPAPVPLRLLPILLAIQNGDGDGGARSYSRSVQIILNMPSNVVQNYDSDFFTCPVVSHWVMS